MLATLGSVAGQAPPEQVQLAAEAEAESRVQERGDECDRSRDRHCGGESERGEQQSDTDYEQPDELREAWRRGSSSSAGGASLGRTHALKARP